MLVVLVVPGRSFTVSDGIQSTSGVSEVSATSRGLKQYHAPALEAYGEVIELTQGTSSNTSYNLDSLSDPPTYISGTS